MKAEMSHKKIPYQATLNWSQKIDIHKAPPQRTAKNRHPQSSPQRTLKRSTRKIIEIYITSHVILTYPIQNAVLRMQINWTY